MTVRSADPLLSFAAAVGLASARETTLIIDALAGMSASGRTIADVIDEGPTRAELSPGRTGVGMIAAGDVTREQISTVVAELSTHWPAIVVRSEFDLNDLPTVPVVPLYPLPKPIVDMPEVAVWQPVQTIGRPPAPGPVLPRLPGRHLRQILARRLPRRCRWLRAWTPIWEMPWA